MINLLKEFHPFHKDPDLIKRDSLEDAVNGLKQITIKNSELILNNTMYEISLNRAFNRYFLKDYLQAIENFDFLLSFEPYSYEIYYYKALAEFFYAIKDPNNYNFEMLDMSLNDFNSCLKINSNYDEVKYYIGVIFFAKNDYSSALFYLNSYIKKHSVSYHARIKIALANALLKNYYSAFNDLDFLIKIYPDYLSVFLYRGIIYLIKNELSSARDDFNYVLRSEPTNKLAIDYKDYASKNIRTPKNRPLYGKGFASLFEHPQLVIEYKYYTDEDLKELNTTKYPALYDQSFKEILNKPIGFNLFFKKI